MLSLMARNQLYQNYQAMEAHEETRDKYVVLMMLNEALDRLSRGSFDLEEFGNFDAPDHADADYAYDETSSPTTAYLATKYRKLWDELPADLLLDEDERTIKYFPNLAASGSLAYPMDLSGEAFDDLEEDRVESEVYLTELRLLQALVDFYINFHAWRLFAEEHLEVSFDELLSVAVPRNDGVTAPSVVPDLDEEFCRNILSLKRDYLEAYPALLEEWADTGALDNADEGVTVDLDARARECAEELAESTEFPVTGSVETLCR